MGKEPKEVTQKEIGKRLKEYIDSRMEKMGIESYRQLDSRSGVNYPRLKSWACQNKPWLTSLSLNRLRYP